MFYEKNRIRQLCIVWAVLNYHALCSYVSAKQDLLPIRMYVVCHIQVLVISHKVQSGNIQALCTELACSSHEIHYCILPKVLGYLLLMNRFDSLDRTLFYSNMTMSLCIRQGSKWNDWFNQCGRTWLLCRNPAEHLWCDFKCRPWAKNLSPNTNDLYIWVQSF